MLGLFNPIQPQRQALERVQGWTRKRFGLDEYAAVLVSEISCAVPGCPPLETVIAFWSDGDRRHHFKLFKPVADVFLDDLPYAWQKNSLAAINGSDYDCC